MQYNIFTCKKSSTLKRKQPKAKEDYIYIYIPWIKLNIFIQSWKEMHTKKDWNKAEVNDTQESNRKLKAKREIKIYKVKRSKKKAMVEMLILCTYEN